MNPRKRFLLLISIMVVITLGVEAVALRLLYETALNEERERLVELVRSQARLIEAVARFDRRYGSSYPGGARRSTLDQVSDAHAHYRGFGRTGEFDLGRRQGDRIEYLLNHRHGANGNLKSVPMGSELAEPMQAALAGRSGTMIGVDYRGEAVLAAFEPVAELNLGIVAKIDMAEVHRPFIRAIAASSAVGLLAVMAGAWLFFAMTNPLIRDLERANAELQSSLEKVKMLSGLLPICSSCKKVRDDKGYWNQIEEYIHEHSEAEFSHGLCPECMQRIYPQYAERMRQEGTGNT